MVLVSHTSHPEVLRAEQRMGWGALNALSREFSAPLPPLTLQSSSRSLANSFLLSLAPFCLLPSSCNKRKSLVSKDEVKPEIFCAPSLQFGWCMFQSGMHPSGITTIHYGL